MPVTNTAERDLYLLSPTLYFFSGGHLDHALEWYVHYIAFLHVLIACLRHQFPILATT